MITRADTIRVAHTDQFAFSKNPLVLGSCCFMWLIIAFSFTMTFPMAYIIKEVLVCNKIR